MSKCARCGDPGPDLRTLWMACLYQMNELNVPFEREDLAVALESHERRFYTLTVCKDCRADWMSVIEKWFNTVPIEESPGTGIFVRQNGRSIEVSFEEYERLRLHQREKAK